MQALELCSTNTQTKLEVRQALKQAGSQAVQHSACQHPEEATSHAGPQGVQYQHPEYAGGQAGPQAGRPSSCPAQCLSEPRSSYRPGRPQAVQRSAGQLPEEVTRQLCCAALASAQKQTQTRHVRQLCSAVQACSTSGTMQALAVQHPAGLPPMWHAKPKRPAATGCCPLPAQLRCSPCPRSPCTVNSSSRSWPCRCMLSACPCKILSPACCARRRS